MDIIEGSIDDLNIIYERYEKDFPADERKDRKQLESLMGGYKYKLLIAKDFILKEILGYAFIYENENSRVIWIDYIAIYPKFQSKGYGTLFFNKIIERRNNVKGIMVEVEEANHVNKKIREKQKRRIDFYKRIGAHRLNIDYYLPIKDGSIPLDLYFIPKEGVKYLSKEVLRNQIYSVFQFIHGDIEHRSVVFSKITESIDDEYFSQCNN
ncbi:GNAT family N-acetyltransferase [Oceanirhabdus sp. W0125-5]|uniref:GNAT family N-acetyltransferase n=1 Tax=Oceanirhabdus sp. W0125-5 TaxID=2999116 RepID=UPI0022F2B32B|nr:GNAT family N-acetyltransferase [Oceanirhabdus sp. W0125-5]WBW95551.1 GNAT family N-acetyltransferase [Oceanirhabdus sp. W0125-5]